MESFETQFIYVDGYYAKPDGKSSPWKRIKITEISNLKKKAENFNVFVTAQKFCSPQRIEDELVWGDLYFDLDASLQYPIEVAKEDAKKLVDFFTKGHGMNQEMIRLAFSGSKGFHLFVNAKILGVQPHIKLNLIFKSIALYLENFLELKTLDTASIYSKRRMMRLSDSLHQKSKLFKIELYHTELEKSIDEIREMAKSPRGKLWQDEEFGNILPGDSISEFYKHFVELYKEQDMVEKLKPHTLIHNTGDLAVCVKDLMNNHIRKSGTRNLATITLASYYKDQGLDEKATIEIILPWAKRSPKAYTTTSDERKITASTISCIKSVYANDYHFVCSVMRSLGEMECAYEKCTITNEEDQAPEKEIKLHLSEASNATYMKKKIKTKVLVAGKDTSPYIVPKRVELKCSYEPGKEDEKCHDCKLSKQGGRYEFELNERNALLLECIQCTTVQQISVLKRLVASQKCDKVRLSILDTGNVEELEITPEIDRQITLVDKVEGSEDYVTRKAYYIGHNMPLNQEVELECYTYPDPKTQHAVHLFSEYNSADTSLNAFKMDEIKFKELSVFQPKKNQTVVDKINAIHKDLELNIHHIWQRTPLFIAFDLVYHSVLNFYFQGEPMKKGWTELLVIGDCVTKDTLILTEDGMKYIGDFDKGYKKDKFIESKDLKSDDLFKKETLPKVAGLDGVSQPTHLYCKSKTKTIKIITARRYCIEGTEKHPIIVNDNGKLVFKELKDLKIGDYVAIQHNHNLFGKQHNPDMGRLLGYLIGDGSCNGEFGLGFTNTIKIVLDDVTELCQRLFNYIPTPGFDENGNPSGLYIQQHIADKIRDHGIPRCLAGTKKVPWFIMESDKETVREFLRGYFETDGYYSPQIETVSIGSKSEQLINEVRMMLLNFGIISTFKISYNKTFKRNYFGLKITDLDFYGKFLDEIGFITERKQKSNIAKPEGNTNRNIVPNISILVDNVWQKYKHAHPEIMKRRAKLTWMSINTLRQVRYNVRGFSYKKLKQFLDGTVECSEMEEWKYLKYLSEQNIYWDFIIKTDNKENETYDFHIPNGHNFISNGFVSSNSGQAKSAASQKIAAHYGFGFRISGENARRTGLAYTWHQTANRWSVSFGIIPRNDKRIVFIDEAGGIDDEDLSKLTDMRSEGIADASGGPIPAKTNARTRLIWMTNTKDGTPLSETPYPVTAILKIFKRTEDIRRLDLAIAVRSGDVPDAMIHQMISQREKTEHIYTSYLCRNLILWAWTRKIDQILISEDTEREILDVAMALSKKYSSLIPLVEPSDQRNKIARLSVAVACRLFSTTDGHNVIVKPEHVKFVSEFLQSQYDSPALDYYNYSRLNKREFHDDEFEIVYNEFNTYTDTSLVADTLTKDGYFKKQTLEDLVGYERETINRLLKFFHKHNLIKAVKNGYKLTAAGTSFLKKYLVKHPTDNLFQQIIHGDQDQIVPKIENDFQSKHENNDVTINDIDDIENIFKDG